MPRFDPSQLPGLASQLFFATPAGIMITTQDGTIIAVNPSFTRITGYEPNDVIGQTPRILSSGRHDQQFYESMWAAINKSGSWQGEIWNRRKNGEVFPEYLCVAAIVDNDEAPTHFVAIFSDIGHIKLIDEHMIHLAQHDPTTGLPNRNLLADRMTRAFGRAQRNLTMVAVLFLDLDNFKQINDSLGHAVGDTVLETIAARLKHEVRAIDTIARVGGDEFVVILEDLTADSLAIDKAQQLLTALSQPVTLEAKTIRPSSSIGIAMFPHHGATADTLLKRADMAMYQAKRAGKNQFRCYTNTDGQ